MKRIVLLLDGTWNQPDTHTNVWRLKLMLARPAHEGVRQLAYYQRGVGTAWYNAFPGGAFGQGLSENVCDAYRWLMEHYDEGDEIYLFGYSRGAFTARSVAGLIAKCGLLTPDAPIAVPEIFEYYRERHVPLYRLEYLSRHAERRERNFTDLENALLRHSKRVPIKFIGLFDTVGALGIPVGRIRGISRSSFAFHHTRLSKIFENAFQALAVDEHRSAFRASLWQRFIPDDGGDTDRDVPAEKENAPQVVEQRWFLGSHGDVGGGGSLNPLAQLPLKWIQERAAHVGLGFRQLVRLRGDEYLGAIDDTYRAFLGGAYRLATVGRRHYRRVSAASESRTAFDGTPGRIETVREVVDESVARRWLEDESYRPPNLNPRLLCLDADENVG